MAACAGQMELDLAGWGCLRLDGRHAGVKGRHRAPREGMVVNPEGNDAQQPWAWMNRLRPTCATRPLRGVPCPKV
jgi:hypothetical protein